MTDTFLRPRRSVLYMPGSNARALEKARDLDADALILDLEDAVAPDAKPAARERVLSAVAAGGYGRRELAIRVNAAGTPWHADDVRAAARSGADAVVLPKVENAGAVNDLEAGLVGAGAPPGLAIWCMIETPRGVLAAEATAAASERVVCLVMGTSDLNKELNARSVAGRMPLWASLVHVMLAARAAGRVALVGGHLDLADHAGLAAACRQGRDMGFDGKTLIHPSQIEAANAAFGPSADEVAGARRILAAWDEAVAAGRGLAVLDGRLVENLHVDTARRTLALAEAIGAAGEPGATGE